MSEITRDGLKKISYILGESQNSILSLLGDLNKTPKVLIELEALLCRLRGSTLFYNEDYSAFRYPAPSDPSVIETFDFIKFSGNDNINFGMQGAFLTKNYDSEPYSFPSVPLSGSWNPSYLGPPCPEGFGTWYYNAWNGYLKEPPSSGFEAGNYELRYNSNYPVRYSGGPDPYTRVAFYKHARWISIYNSDVTARHYDDYIYVFEINKSQLDGIEIINSETDAPIDVRFMYYNKLLQKHDGTNWESIDINTSSNIELNYLAHEIEDNGDSYIIRINIPDDLIFDPSTGIGGSSHHPDTWWHLIMFWGSKDEKVTDDIVTFDDTPQEYVLDTNEFIVWNVKHFFTTRINSKLTWTDHAINDSTIYNLLNNNLRYLIANNRLHFQLIDGNSNVLPEINPYKYKILDEFLTGTNFSINSVSNYANDLDVNEFQSAILMVKTYGAESTYSSQNELRYKGFTTFEIKLGPKFSSEEARSDWENFEYYPTPDNDYFTFAKIILKRAKSESYGSVEENFINNLINDVINPFSNDQTTILQNVEILWIDQLPSSFAIKPHGDPVLSSILTPALFKTLTNFRNERKDQAILNLAARLLISASRTPSTIANSATALINPEGAASNIFRRLLKSPVDPLLQPDTDETLAIQFNPNERRIIESIASKPPSTEMLRLNADNLFLINNKLNLANTFEIYLEPSDQCTAADNQASGNRVGLDYTLRLYLEDQDENTLMKDWYIMASKYFVTNEEYNNRILKEQSVIGYFTYDNIDTIDQWRLQGYASIVPDLTMGESRVLTTRFVSPPDSEQETEEQFRARYEALGRTQEEIDELVLKFLEAGGEFYNVDLFQYNNEFTSVKEAAINITTLTEGTPYWQSNIVNFNVVNQPDPDEPLEGFYSDSFTISLEGASGEDLEAYGKQATTIYAFTPSSSIVDLTLHRNNYAFTFNSGVGGRMTTVALKLKADLFDPDTLLLSNAGLIKINLYSSDTDNTKPDILLKSSSNSILFTDLQDDTYTEFYWDLDFNLTASTDYWIELSLNSSPQGGDIQLATQIPYNQTVQKLEFEAFSFINLSDTNSFSCAIPISVILSDTNTSDGLSNSTGSLDIRIYSSDSNGNIDSIVSFVSANDSIDFADIKNYEIIFNFDATVNLDKDQKYWIVFVPSERQRGGTISVNLNSILFNDALYTQIVEDNGVYNLWDNWEDNNYKTWLKITKIIPEIYGYFNRDENNLNAYLPGSNTNRITTALLSKEASWAWTIKKFPEPSRVYIYPRFSPGYYVPFFRDIYVSVRLLVGGKPKDYILHLDPTTTPVEPIAINESTDLAESIVYMYVAKTLEELQNGYHGAPPGDRLVIRST